ncbi:hypothetical protein OG864_51605 [Streptomyces sp. NBC_00124]|uniref:hypothetical protein n=1 Tax=Streptomyces sp. NBC_00124 TaxID=2975662 RepID=UPI00224D1495|nr:hypothetical protein [Streptomyces sp. NBC_00124]MCX5367129.1 hypothetical protein [Streptomyces sp. NBC_00124]
MLTIRSIALVTAAPLVLAAAGIAHPHGLSRSTASDWTQLHIALLPVFPLLTVGLLVPLWHRPRIGLAGFATVVAWACAFVYAAFYTGLDAVAGIAAGTAVEHAGETASLGPVKRPLYDVGEALGQAGAYALIGAIAATAVALLPKYGARILPGTMVLLAAGWSFVDSHIFWPRGVWTMLGFALGFALLHWGAGSSAPAGGGGMLPRHQMGDHGTGR